jgi:hypothetical protein
MTAPMTDTTIPPEALEALRESLWWANLSEADARAACLAMLTAWPGVDHQPPQYGDSGPPVLILPLPQEEERE